MTTVLLATVESDCDAVVPSLSLLSHPIRLVEPNPASLLVADAHDVVIVDGRRDLADARGLCGLLSAGDAPVIAVLNEGGLVTVTSEWGVDDILLPTVGPAELDARIRLLARASAAPASESGRLTAGELTIEEETYTVRLKGRALELTYKEFELLKYLVGHSGRVFTRAQLLQEVWGYDFFGGTRTVDVHIRRLRAKLGPEHDAMIGTVRGVGYKFVSPSAKAARNGSRRANQEKRDEAITSPARRNRHVAGSR